MKRVIISLFAFFLFTAVSAEPDWELKKNKEGIEVYSASVPGSTTKAVRVDCVLNASLSSLTAMLLDIKAHEQWVYNTKTSYLVKKIGDQDEVFYSEVSMPWPLQNRDVVIELKITQNPSTKVVMVDAEAVQGYVPTKHNDIRVPMSKAIWTVTPLEKDKIRIEYIGQADPGGSLPAWAVNLFLTKGPFETFKKLKQTLSSDNYMAARFDFIKD